ncbi:Hypothetical predicted protein [Xyrichtys novacula]|uniref:Uncharacterized protein n=1 Tax=Xyrichtys novacula TaxID=13765 RepID=A0AAV1FPQ5_XYRNO|nr:Hypothetical predicted protein [Xyrichtys novacula]
MEGLKGAVRLQLPLSEPHSASPLDPLWPVAPGWDTLTAGPLCRASDLEDWGVGYCAVRALAVERLMQTQTNPRWQFDGFTVSVVFTAKQLFKLKAQPEAPAAEKDLQWSSQRDVDPLWTRRGVARDHQASILIKETYAST